MYEIYSWFCPFPISNSSEVLLLPKLYPPIKKIHQVQLLSPVMCMGVELSTETQATYQEE